MFPNLNKNKERLKEIGVWGDDLTRELDMKQEEKVQKQAEEEVQKEEDEVVPVVAEVPEEHLEDLEAAVASGPRRMRKL